MHRALMIATLLALAGCAEKTEEASIAAETRPGVAFEDVPEGVDEGAAPHVHDYWQGRERVTLLDASYTTEALDAVRWGVISTRVFGEPMLGGAAVDLPDGAIVYEGTGVLEVTVTWTDPAVTGVRFIHRHAGSGDIQWWTPAPNGETVALEVTPEMTDMPHAAVSRWDFLFGASGTPALAVGTLHIRMDIVKTRDVAEWPAHPDHWAAGDALLVVDAEGASRSGLAPTPFLLEDETQAPADAVRAQGLVPMETANLTVVVTVLDVEPDHVVESLHLSVRTAAHLEFDFSDADEATSVSDDGVTWTWVLPVAMETTDNPYASESAWAFRVEASYASPVPGGPSCREGCGDAELRYRIVATATRVAGPGG